MDQSLNVAIHGELTAGGRLVDLLARFAAACRTAATRSMLGPGEETLVSRSTGGRC